MVYKVVIVGQEPAFVEADGVVVEKSGALAFYNRGEWGEPVLVRMISPHRWSEVELQEVSRKAEGVLLPGWVCKNCRCFNGDAKERLERCRSCDASRAGG